MSRMNAFAALAGSDSEPETTHESKPTIPVFRKKQKKWKKIDLAALPDPANRRQRQQPSTHSDAPRRQYRRTKDGRLVRLRSAAVNVATSDNKQTKKVEPKPDVVIKLEEFPTFDGKTSPQPSTPCLRGSWQQGVQAVIDAADLEDPSIEQKRKAAARAAWVTKQRTANRKDIYISDDEEFSDNDDEEFSDDEDDEPSALSPTPIPVVLKNYEEIWEIEDANWYDTQYQKIWEIEDAMEAKPDSTQEHGSGWWSD